MNKNIKKVAAVILATNVLASTVITTLPTGTQAAEQIITQAQLETSINQLFYSDALQVIKTDATKDKINELQATLNNTSATIVPANKRADLQAKLDRAKTQLIDIHKITTTSVITKDKITITANNLPTTSTSTVSQARGTMYVTFLDKDGNTVRFGAAGGGNQPLSYATMNLPNAETTSETFDTSYFEGIVTHLKVEYVLSKLVAFSLDDFFFLDITSPSPVSFDDDIKSAVDSLFIDGDISKGIKEGLSQADIDAAQAKINDVTDEAKRAEFQAELDKAQAAMNEKTAELSAKTAIDSLSTGGKIKADLTQEELDAVQAKINDVKDETKKAELQADLAKAIDVYTAIHAFQSLTITDNYTAVLKLDLPAGFPYSYVFEKNGAYTGHLVSGHAYYLGKLVDGAQLSGLKEGDKINLYTQVNGVKYVLATKTVTIALDQADQAVKELFVDNDTSKAVKSTLTQAILDAAQAKVNAVTDAAQKLALQANLDKASEAFNMITPTTINALTTDSVKVAGKGEPNAPVTIKNGTTTIGTGTVKTDGTFEVAIAKQAADATITATVTKASNGKTATASTKVTQGIDYSLTANGYKMGDATLTGKVGKNVSKVRLWINGTVAVQGVINADGTYEFPTAANFIKLIGDKVEVVAVDSKFVEVNRTTVTVTGTSTFDNALTVAKFNTGDTKITGTIGKDISKVRLWVNDKVVAQAPTTTDGTYAFANADKFITSPLDKVEVVGVDAQYKEMNRKTVSLPGSDTYNNTFSVDNYFIGQNTLGGSYGQNTSKVRLWVNGVVVKQADLNPADNTYTLKGIFGLIKSKTDVAEVVYVDAQYKEIKRVAVLVK